MLATRFDTNIVLSERDFAGMARPLNPVVVMDAVEDAVAAIPGAANIDICYLGARDPRSPRVVVSRHGANSPSGDLGAMARIIRRQVEARARRAIASLVPRAA